MTRPVNKPLIRRRLVLHYEISDGKNIMECKRMVSHDLLDAMRKDVRGALLWNETEVVIKNTELAWAAEHEKPPADE